MLDIFRRLISAQLLRFLIVGLSNTLVSYLIFLGFLLLLSDIAIRATIAQLVGYTGGIFWSYFWNKKWTFNSTASNSPTIFFRFVTTQLLMALLSALCIGVLVDYFHYHPTLSWVCVMALITVLNYWVTKQWVFQQKQR